MPRPEGKPFNGWGPFTFGMNFEEAVTAYPGLVWDAESLRKCRAELPARSCTLNPAQGSRVPPTAGLDLLPRLVFNQQGKLATVHLSQFLRGDIEAAQCERAYGQLLDDLQATWGPPAPRSANTRGMLKRSTPEGREFLLGSDGKAVTGTETFHAQPDGRRIVLQSGYVAATDSAPAVCHLSIDYRGPESLQPPPEQRPYPLKNWQ
jgi:hypothetical protein